MGTGFLVQRGGSGGGSGGLELTVVGGITRPAKPTQNMIWANTPNDITSVFMAGEKPRNPANGILWLKLADSGKIKIPSPVGKDWLIVYPLSAEQYVGGEWTIISAMIYQGCDWVSLEKTLLPPSTGWRFTKIFSNSTLGSCSFDGNVFVGSYSSSGRGAGIIKSIDFTDYKYIEVYYTLKNKDTESSTSPGYGGVVLLVTDYELNSNSNEIAAKWNTNKDTENGFVSIDVSGISGIHNLVVGIRGYSGTNIKNEIRITKIKGVT